MRVFLDIDGVLADFAAGFAMAHRAGVAAAGITVPEDVTRWRFWEMLGATEEELWMPRMERAEFWSDLPMTRECNAVVTLAEQALGVQSVTLVTTPGRSPGSHAGKYQWIRQHLPYYAQRYTMTHDKSLLAHRGALLIDDGDAACKAFRDAGGWAILLPRPWNEKRDQAADAIGALAAGIRRVQLNTSHYEA